MLTSFRDDEGKGDIDAALMEKNEAAEVDIKDGKSKRKRFKRQKLKLKKKEAKQNEQQVSSVIPLDSANTELNACKEVPTSPFTFSSSLKPLSCSFGPLKDSLSSSGIGSTSTLEKQTQQPYSDSNAYVMSESRPTLKMGAIKGTNNLLIDCRSPIIYCQDEGAWSFGTQLSPLYSCESLLLSNDSVQTTLLERLPVAGRTGAFSTPTSPVHSEYGFWESDITSIDSASPALQDFKDDEEKKVSTPWIRRASSMEFKEPDWNEEWALDSLNQHQKSLQKGEARHVTTWDWLNYHGSMMDCGDSSLFIPSDTTNDEAGQAEAVQAGDTSQDSSSSPLPETSSNENNVQVIQVQGFHPLRIEEESEGQIVDTQCSEDEFEFSKKKNNILYNPIGLFKGNLQALFDSGGFFFRVFSRIYGEVHNEQGHYSIVSFSRVKVRIKEMGRLSSAPENMIWQFGHNLMPVGWSYLKDIIEEGEQRPAKLYKNFEPSTLSPALQRIKERLQREREQIVAVEKPTKGKGSGIKGRLTGGKSAKWAAMRRKNNATAGKLPQKVVTVQSK